MEKRITSIAAVVVVTFSAAAAANDEVAASFQRMFDHTPAAMPLGTRSDPDPLPQAVNAQLRASLAAEAAASGQSSVAYGRDPLLASFERMLSHPPTALTPTVPDGFAADPLVDAVAAPLREVAAGHVLPARFAALKVSARR